MHINCRERENSVPKYFALHILRSGAIFGAFLCKFFWQADCAASKIFRGYFPALAKLDTCDISSILCTLYMK